MISLIDKFNQVSMLDMPDSIAKIYKDVPEINEIDNRGFPICRPLFSHSSLPFNFELEQVDVNKYDGGEFVYCVYVHHNQKLWVEHIDLIPKKVLDLVRNGKGYLLFDNTLEGNRIDDEWFITPFYKNIEKLNLPFNKIVFVTNNLIGEETHNSWFESQNHYKDKIKLISFMWNVHDVRRLIETDNLPNHVNIKDEIKYKTDRPIKHFLKINRTNRPERNLFMLFMNHHNLFEKSLISFPSFPDEDYPTMFDRYTTNENISDLRTKVPFDIDHTDTDNHGPAGHGKGFFDADLPFQPIHYKNSFISVIMAAFPFEPNAHHLHSSTFNPMYCGHPIIQFGPYQSLKVMRDYGFKTFDKWWDESYDEEHDNWKRLMKVMNLVLDISKKTPSDLLSMYKDMEDVLQHNVDLISNYDIKKKLFDRIF